jgi:hypothetical protein
MDPERGVGGGVGIIGRSEPEARGKIFLIFALSGGGAEETERKEKDGEE